MKKILLAFGLALSCLALVAQQPAGPRPSPAGSATTTVGLTDIKITYFRPQVKDRKIFGAGEDYLQPFGQLWRAGANTGTVITFSDTVQVEGHQVPKGEYLLFMIPGADMWTVTFYTDIALGGNYDAYDKSKEFLRFQVKPAKLTEKVDTMTFNITDLSADSKHANIQMAWENTSVKFAVTVQLPAQK